MSMRPRLGASSLKRNLIPPKQGAAVEAHGVLVHLDTWDRRQETAGKHRAWSSRFCTSSVRPGNSTPPEKEGERVAKPSLGFFGDFVVFERLPEYAVPSEHPLLKQKSHRIGSRRRSHHIRKHLHLRSGSVIYHP